jgi:hypothetical protein
MIFPPRKNLLTEGLSITYWSTVGMNPRPVICKRNLGKMSRSHAVADTVAGAGLDGFVWDWWSSV